jgi:small subunit ribosomal protein S3Ae
MVKAQPVVKGKLIKKSWHPIIATKAFNSTPLGETYVAEPSSMKGMNLTVNLANLTGDIRQQGISLKFKVIDIDQGSGVADIIGYEASPSHLKRLVRRGIERLDDSIECRTSDNKLIKIKPFGVTRALTGKAKISLVRIKLREAIASEVSAQTFDDLVTSVISHKFQSSLKSSVKKIFPLRALEIRKLKVISLEDKPKALGEDSAPESSVHKKTRRQKAETEDKKEEISETAESAGSGTEQNDEEQGAIKGEEQH